MAMEWEIVSQRQVEDLTDQGTFKPVMEINFRTLPEEIPGQIKVPLRLYTADYVRSEVEARAKRMKEINSL